MKLYFLCGLPGERHVDLDGIVDMAETIARIGKEVDGPLQGGDRARLELRPEAAHAVSVERHADARVLPLGRRLPAPPQANQVREDQAARHRDEPARRHPDPRRPPRGAGAVRGVEARRAARRLEGMLQARALVADVRATSASTSTSTARGSGRSSEMLPWDHVNVKKGRAYLEKEQERSVIQLRVMAEAVNGEGDKEAGGCGG